METSTSQRGNPLRATVQYLVALRPIQAHAIEIRRPWIQGIGLLIEDTRAGDPLSIAQHAMKLGSDQVMLFRESRRQLHALEPPAHCQPCHDALTQWLEVHIAACELLIEMGSNREMKRLRDVQERVGEGRVWAQRFNTAYTQLVEDLRLQVADALARQGIKGGRLRSRIGRRGRRGWWPFGRNTQNVA